MNITFCKLIDIKLQRYLTSEEREAIRKIPRNPADRLPANARRLLSDPTLRTDCHSHVFNLQAVPDDFLGVRIPYFNNKYIRSLATLLDNIIPWDREDKLSLLADFMRAGNRDIQEIAKDLFTQMPGNWAHCLLGMDMAKGTSGYQVMEISQQMNIMRNLANNSTTPLLNFVPIDPRRYNVFEDYYLKALRPTYQFTGVKIYPSQGYMPSHPELMKIYAANNYLNIPTISHCSDWGVNTSYHYLDVQGLKLGPDGVEPYETNKFKLFNASWSTYFNGPEHWLPVLHEFPELPLDLAHFGGNKAIKQWMHGKKDSWAARIFEMIESGKYPNLYTDLSYVIQGLNDSPKNKKVIDFFLSQVKNSTHLKDKLLFGTDYWMVLLDAPFQKMLEAFRSSISDDLWDVITISNPRRFLGLENPC